MKHLAAAAAFALAACATPGPSGNPLSMDAPAGAASAAIAETAALQAAELPGYLPDAVMFDMPRNNEHPARNRQLLIPSEGQGMNALFLLAPGDRPKPTLLLLHGLPGNERNMDLAQSVRRSGWNVLTFSYRGAWGSPGRFSIAGAIEDAAAALAFLRTPEAARLYQVDPARIVLAGHSMGGLAAALNAARDPSLAGLVLLDAWNAGPTGAMVAAGGADARSAFEQRLDDLGNALQGATAASLTAELLARHSGWDLRSAAPALARLPVLSVYARHGIAEDNKALAAAIAARPGARLHAVEIDSDHAFADKRMALQFEVVRWLQGLEASRTPVTP